MMFLALTPCPRHEEYLILTESGWSKCSRCWTIADERALAARDMLDFHIDWHETRRWWCPYCKGDYPQATPLRLE